MTQTLTGTLKGFRDFLPAEKAVRDRLERELAAVFQRFGFQPLETPTLEYAALILGKYGEEADRLVYTFEDRGGRKVALPYDQTVPTARVLAQYQRELPRHFRRYAIRDVFRAENPQRGRFREFKQCDIDIFGSSPPLADAEIVACTWCAFAAVGFPEIRIELNDRRLLFERLGPHATERVDVVAIVRAVDKLDKLGEEGVVAELVGRGLDPAAARGALDAIRSATPPAELAAVLHAARVLGVPDDALVFSPTLARGLDYYTGPIFEVRVPSFTAGSLAGGGRYDELIGRLGGPPTPAVGLAFGFDRMVEAALELGLLPAGAGAAEVLVTIFDERTCNASLEAAARLRAAGVSCEIYTGQDKLGKQFKLADQKKIPLVLILGPDELARDEVTLREMATGEQTAVPRASLVDAVRVALRADG